MRRTTVGLSVVVGIVAIGMLAFAGSAKTETQLASVSDLPNLTGADLQATHEGNPTLPCPSTHHCALSENGCHPGTNCSSVDTGEHACGWDGTLNPPEFSCTKTTTIRIVTCNCVSPEGCDPCPLCGGTSVRLICQ
jgi:hypothetical protein